MVRTSSVFLFFTWRRMAASTSVNSLEPWRIVKLSVQGRLLQPATLTWKPAYGGPQIPPNNADSVNAINRFGIGVNLRKSADKHQGVTSVPQSIISWPKYGLRSGA